MDEIIGLKIDNFLKTLRSKLEEKHLSVPQFANKMGIPRATIYAWLNKKSIMSLAMYYKACEVLKIKTK